MSNSGQSNVSVATAFIACIITVVLIGTVWSFFQKAYQPQTNQINESNSIKTIDVAEELKFNNPKTYQLPVTGYVLDFTRQNASMTSTGRVQITASNKVVILNGTEFENGVPFSYMNNENVLKAIPLTSNASITLAKPISNSQTNNSRVNQVTQPSTIHSSHSEEDAPIILIAGEFKAVSGDCTPYCIITITGNSLLLEGINESGSTNIRYRETYFRTSNDPNSFHHENNANSVIRIINTNEFHFSNSDIERTCRFVKTMD